MEPFFSVVIPLYNKEKFIKATLDSVLSQDFINYEIIVINDGSTDNSLNIVKDISNSKIKIYDQKNGGASSARNLGIEKASADYIAFLDADDVWYKNHLSTLHNLITDFPEASMFSTGYLISYNSHLKKTKFKNIPFRFYGIVEDFFKHNLPDSLMHSSVSAIKKNTLQVVNGFDLNLKSGQDTDLWVRLALNNKLAFHNCVTAIYIKNDDSLSNSKHVKSRIKFLDRFLHLESNNRSLKKYMDMNRYAVALNYKMLERNTISKSIYKSISKNNLNKKQRAIYILPSFLLRILYKIKRKLDKVGLFFHLYR